MSRQLDKPAFVVRVIWPAKGDHADATKAIGEALAAIRGAQSYTKREHGIYSQGYESTYYHFTFDTTHEIEKPEV